MKYGRQEWALTNLSVVSFLNGDPIMEARTKDEWQLANHHGTPAWCFYDNDPLNGEIFGRLYNWYALIDKRRVYENGWHVPSDIELAQLVKYLGDYKNVGKAIKSQKLWRPSNFPGTNESEFNLLPAGYRNFYGDFFFINQHAYLWSTTEHYNHLAWYHTVDFFTDEILRYYNVKGNGFSCRCVRNS